MYYNTCMHLLWSEFNIMYFLKCLLIISYSFITFLRLVEEGVSTCGYKQLALSLRSRIMRYKSVMLSEYFIASFIICFERIYNIWIWDDYTCVFFYFYLFCTIHSISNVFMLNTQHMQCP
jgi:hypothetical protein